MASSRTTSLSCAAAFALLVACRSQPTVAPSLACSGLTPPPPWYVVELAPDEVCPADLVCLTKAGAQALDANYEVMRWARRAYLRCGPR